MSHQAIEMSQIQMFILLSSWTVVTF